MNWRARCDARSTPADRCGWSNRDCDDRRNDWCRIRSKIRVRRMWVGPWRRPDWYWRLAKHDLGVLEFAAQPRHQPARPYVQLLQVVVRHRGPFRQPATRHRLRVGDRRLVRLLLPQLLLVLLVQWLQLGPRAADGACGGRQRVVVRGGGVVGALYAVDELVEFGDVRPRGGVGLRRPRLGEATPVFPQAAQVGQGEVADLAPARDLLPLACGVLVLHARPHAEDVHQPPVGQPGGASAAPFDHGRITRLCSGAVGSASGGIGRATVAEGPASARSTSATRAEENASASP